MTTVPARLQDTPLGEWLNALAAPLPTPGGIAAAAVSGAMGAALLSMVADLPPRRGRGGVSGSVTDALADCRDRLLRLADDDIAAVRTLMAAERAAREHPDDAARCQARDAARVHATMVPLEVQRACREALSHAADIGAEGPRAAQGDLAAGVDLLLAAATAASRTVRLNASGITDAATRAEVVASADALDAAVATRRAGSEPSTGA